MQKSYLNEYNVDSLARMLAALLSEVWIMRDRMAVTEKLLAEHTGLSSQDIDEYLPDPAFAATLETLRERLVGHVVTAPIAPDDHSVSAILDRAGLTVAAARAGGSEWPE